MSKLPKRAMKILLVDESANDRAHFVRMFRQYPAKDAEATAILSVDCDVFEAKDFDEAGTLFSSLHPDLIMIGLHQPSNTAGREFCRLVRQSEEKRHTGVVFIAFPEAGDENLSVECLELGADDFIRSEVSPREMLARINVVLRMKAMTDELRSANHRLEVLSLTDELTGLHNMRSFNAEYNKLLHACGTQKTAMGVLMMDLDHFKSVNDTANHLVGSFVISQVGKLILYSKIFGPDACAARYGGDEYIICCPSPSGMDMVRRAEALRQLIEKAVFKKDGFVTKITSSIGVSFVEPGFDGKADDPIKAADVMLYRSKEAGRNRVSGMVLRYPVDFDHVGRSHLIDGNASGDDDGVTRFNNLKVFK